MIRQIRGKVLSAGLTSAVVEVAGFGIEVRMSAPGTLTADRDFFELILTVSGVGPKTALSVLRRAPREALEGAISTRDLAYLTKVVGLGKKSAEKMLVELADKVGPRAHESPDGEVFDTLVALGYTEREARKALQNIPDSAVGKDVRLKAALSSGQ